jgi:undecaprenyl diphosphate synthase
MNQMPKKAPTSLPKHVGFIIDGNRRWAKSKGRPTFDGHRKGAEVFKELSLAAFERGVQYVSAYVFSTENWERTEEEVGGLMRLVITATEKYLDTFDKAGVKIVVVGRRTGLDKKVLDAIERTEAKTKDNTQGTLVLCFNYSGRVELVDAVRRLIAQGLGPQQITPMVLTGALYAPEIPPVDLVIRTSGEQRISDFMLFRIAYSEFYFAKENWPDFTEKDLDEALDDYAKRMRRFGV